MMPIFSRIGKYARRRGRALLRETPKNKVALSCPLLAGLMAFTWPCNTPGASCILASGKGAAPMGFEIQATDFKPGGDIPKKFTCDGPDASPSLSWTEPPAGTKSFALIMDDPDAPGGTFVHWVLYNLPGSTRRLPEGVPKEREIKGGGSQGVNDFGRTGYGGACPPPGKPHRYFFKLYALDGELKLKAGATKKDVEQAMKGHIQGQAEVMGRYRR